MEVHEVVFWILGVMQALIMLFMGMGAKILFSVISDLKRSNERLETRVNAMEVSIAKFNGIVSQLERIETKQDKHMSYHERQEDTVKAFWIEYTPGLEWAKVQAKAEKKP